MFKIDEINTKQRLNPATESNDVTLGKKNDVTLGKKNDVCRIVLRDYQ